MDNQEQQPEDQKPDDRGMFTDPHHIRSDMKIVVNAMKSRYPIEDWMRKLATKVALELISDGKTERIKATGLRAFNDIERLALEQDERDQKAAKEAGNEAGRSIFDIASEQADAMDLTILAPGAIRANGRHNGKANGNGNGNAH